MKFFWFMTFLGGVTGSAVLVNGLYEANGAPQQAAAAAMAAAFVILPYCMARAVEGLAASDVKTPTAETNATQPTTGGKPKTAEGGGLAVLSIIVLLVGVGVGLWFLMK